MPSNYIRNPNICTFIIMSNAYIYTAYFSSSKMLEIGHTTRAKITDSRRIRGPVIMQRRDKQWIQSQAENPVHNDSQYLLQWVNPPQSQLLTVVADAGHSILYCSDTNIHQEFQSRYAKTWDREFSTFDSGTHTSFIFKPEFRQGFAQHFKIKQMS